LLYVQSLPYCSFSSYCVYFHRSSLSFFENLSINNVLSISASSHLHQHHPTSSNIIQHHPTSSNIIVFPKVSFPTSTGTFTSLTPSSTDRTPIGQHEARLCRQRRLDRCSCRPERHCSGHDDCPYDCDRVLCCHLCSRRCQLRGVSLNYTTLSHSARELTIIRRICLGLPHPNAQEIGDVTACVAGCDQGDGSKAASDRYGVCREACLADFMFSQTYRGDPKTRSSPASSTSGNYGTISSTDKAHIRKYKWLIAVSKSN
jgi:hypothetical protein